MYNLIRKDFIAGGLFLAGAVPLLSLLTMAAIGTMLKHFGGIIPGIFLAIVAVTCSGTSFVVFGLDTSFGTEATYASLPLRRGTIVLARYASSILIALLGFSSVLLTCLFSESLFQYSDPVLSVLYSLNGIMGMAVMLLFLQALMLPFAFKFGAGKGALVALLIPLALSFAVPVMNFLLTLFGSPLEIDVEYLSLIVRDLFVWITTLEVWARYFLILAFIAFLMDLSAMLSIRFYSRRDISI